MLKINYNGLIADMREEDLEAGIAYLSQCGRGERRQILRSAEEALDRVLRLPSDERNAFSEQQLQHIANDIGIWFVGEVLAGRAEQYGTAVQ